MRPTGTLLTGLLLAVALVCAGAATANAFQTFGVTVYNVSNDQITVGWPQYNVSDPNSDINVYQESVSGSQMLFLGQTLIPTQSSEESSTPFLVSIQDSVSGVNLEFSISANGCQYEPFTWALSNYLSFCRDSPTQDAALTNNTNLLSYYINNSKMLVCIKGNPATGLDNGLNYNVGITQSSQPSSSQAYCYQPDAKGYYLPEYFPTMHDTANAFGDNAQYYIALGSYAATAGPAVTSQAFSGLSPSEVTPCIGSECTVPSNATNWPLTIYYYGTSSSSGGFNPGFQYNSTITPSTGQGLVFWTSDATVNPWGQEAINVPSHLSNYGDAGSEDTYIPIANGVSNISSIPMPCWPTFTTSGTASCNGEPLYNTSPATPPSAKTLAELESAANDAATIITLFSVF